MMHSDNLLNFTEFIQTLEQSVLELMHRRRDDQSNVSKLVKETAVESSG